MFCSASCPRGADDLVDQRCELHGLWVELELAGLDLREVEHLVDEAKKVGTGAIYALQWLLRLFRTEARRVGDHHLGQPDDGVERRAQLVAHAGDELRLVLARHLQLTALVLDLGEQARVLDRQHRLGGEGLQQFDRALGEFAGCFATDHQGANDPIGSEQGYDQAARDNPARPMISVRLDGSVCSVGNLDLAPALRRRRSTASREVGYDDP